MKRNDFFVLKSCVLLILAGGLLISCSRDKTVSIACQDRIGDAPFILLAEESGGENYRFSRFSSGPETAEALITGSVNLATMGDTTALQVLSRYPGRFVLIGSHSTGPGRHRVVVSDREIVSLKDLEGRRLAVKQGTSTHGALLLTERREGVDLSGRLVDLKPGLQLNALASGEVDAIVASEPTPSIAEALGYGRVLASLKIEGFQFPIVMMADRAWAEKNRKEIARLLEGLKTVDSESPDSRQKLGEILGMEEPVLQSSMALHNYAFVSASGLKDELTALHGALSEQGYFDPLPDWEDSLFIP